MTPMTDRTTNRRTSARASRGTGGDGMTIVPGTALVYLSSAGRIWAYDLAGHPQGEVGTLA